MFANGIYTVLEFDSSELSAMATTIISDCIGMSRVWTDENFLPVKQGSIFGPARVFRFIHLIIQKVLSMIKTLP